MRVELERGVADLLWRLGEEALTVELTLDFEHDGMKSAVAFAGASEARFGYQHVRVDGLDLWWRQRLVLADRESQVTRAVRPRRLVVRRRGRALDAFADYA